jgi:hypothetical protein
VRRVVVELDEPLTAPFALVEQVIRRQRAFRAQPEPRSVGTLFAPDVS